MGRTEGVPPIDYIYVLYNQKKRYRVFVKGALTLWMYRMLSIPGPATINPP
jgi:hypothetical protein